MNLRHARIKPDTMPPDRFAKEPLTPLPSEQNSGTSEQQIIQEIEDRRTGRSSSTNPWLRYRLSQAAYKRLEKRFLGDGFVQHKLKFDYFPSSNIFVLRMHTLLHEAMKAEVVREIELQLLSISNGEDPASAFAKSIRHRASMTLSFDDFECGKHDPDALFRHRQAQYPGVILEVSYSQKRKDLPRLADDYILGSRGSIRVVVGIDVEYKGKSATLSIWQPRIQVNEAGEEELVAHPTMLNQEFRKENGKVVPHTGLSLCLEDFAPQSLSKQTKFGADIFISSTKLCAYLHDAEQEMTQVNQRLGCTETLKSSVRIRRRSSSSVEQLNTDDEAKFQQDEQRAAKRSKRADGDYGGD